MTDNLPAETEHKAVQLGTLEGGTPAQLVAGATEMAGTLAQVIENARLFSNIQGRKFVKVEGWTTLTAMLGVFPREVPEHSRWLRVDDNDVYEACVELVSQTNGAVIARATAECGSADEVAEVWEYDSQKGRKVSTGKYEPTWAKRARYAKRSMAITRATGKAARMAFSWIVTLAGFEGTPAEEVPDGGFDRSTGEVYDAPRTQPGSPQRSGAKPLPNKTPKGELISEMTPRNLQWWAENARGEDVRKACQMELDRRRQGEDDQTRQQYDTDAEPAQTGDTPDQGDAFDDPIPF